MCILRNSLIIIVITVLLTSVVVSAASDMDSLFALGNKAYEDKDYKTAIAEYLTILDKDVESASLYYNLGNAYFESGDLGRAVLYFRRAQRLAPADEDLVHNLEFVREFSRIQMEGVQLNPINRFIESLLKSYRLDTLAWIASIVFVSLCLLLIGRFGLGYNNSVLRVTTIVVLIVLLGVSGLTTYKYRNDYLTRWGVVVSSDSRILSGPNESAELEFEGAPGLVVEILSETSEYFNVLFENKRRGWIKKSYLSEI